MKINFKDLTLLDIEWKEVKQTKEELPVYKMIANAIFMHSMDIELSDISKRIYAWEEVELREKEIEEIIGIIKSDKFPVIPMVKRCVIDFLSKK